MMKKKIIIKALVERIKVMNEYLHIDRERVCRLAKENKSLMQLNDELVSQNKALEERIKAIEQAQEQILPNKEELPQIKFPVPSGFIIRDDNGCTIENLDEYFDKYPCLFIIHVSIGKSIGHRFANAVGANVCFGICDRLYELLAERLAPVCLVSSYLIDSNKIKELAQDYKYKLFSVSLDYRENNEPSDEQEATQGNELRLEGFTVSKK